MKITPRILHIPPYISTAWSQVRALSRKETDLLIFLVDGTSISIPSLSHETIQEIFSAHATFLEGQQQQSTSSIQTTPLPFQLFQSTPNSPLMSTNPEAAAHFRFGFDSADSLQTAMHHNPAQANMPDLPKEIVNKIAEIAKIVAPDDIKNIPKPEPHCNCTHCQISRAIHDQFDPKEPSQISSLPLEEEVSDKDLHFQEWEISQVGDKLYSVVNPLDREEKYSVFLGEPVGCTCGKQGCEHILAVLKS